MGALHWVWKTPGQGTDTLELPPPSFFLEACEEGHLSGSVTALQNLFLLSLSAHQSSSTTPSFPHRCVADSHEVLVTLSQCMLRHLTRHWSPSSVSFRSSHCFSSF